MTVKSSRNSWRKGKKSKPFLRNIITIFLTITIGFTIAININLNIDLDLTPLVTTLGFALVIVVLYFFIMNSPFQFSRNNE